MNGDVIVTVTLNAALHVAYAVLAPGGTIPITTEELGRFAADYRRLLDAVRVESSRCG